jgi:beta propeller repeat protein
MDPQTRRRVALLALAGMLLDPSLSTPASPTSAQAQTSQTPYAVERSVLADRKKDQVQPRISGTWVVWKDYRGHSLRAVDDSPNAEIFGIDLDSGQEYELADTDNATDPAIDGSLAVWTQAGRETDIVGWDFAGSEYVKIATGRGRQERPAVSGRLVVWQDNRNGSWDIFLRDLDAPESGDAPLFEQSEDQEHPAISGRTVVWEDRRDRGAGADIFAMELDDQKVIRLTSSHDAFEPAISGRWVVWVGRVDQAVFARNLDEDKPRRLTKGPGGKSQPAISGDFVVWTDERNGNRDVYGYDLVAGVEFPIAVADGPQDAPSVDGATVVWSDGRGDNRDIVMGRVAWPRPLGPEPSPEPTPSVASSSPPAGPPALAQQPPPQLTQRYVVANTDGAGASLRAGPGLNADRLKVLPEGASVTALGPTQSADGLLWRQVRDPNNDLGWIASDYLAPAP